MSKNPAATPVAPRKKPPILAITLAIAAVFLVVAIAISFGGDDVVFGPDGTARLTGATADQCQQVVYYYAPGADVQLATEALFAAIRRVEGVAEVIAFQNPPSIIINFCGSAIQEPAIRAALEPTGFLAPPGVGGPVGTGVPATVPPVPGAPVPVPAPVAPAPAPGAPAPAPSAPSTP
ncbi:MAG: hypothetical protein M1617_07175 [Actinobacteria bacterium]|nr:hypothetical protein [Actinomycetota bacterium]